MRELTRAEEQIMQLLWQLGKGNVNDILELFSEPKPAYNTVSTIVRILETKGFVGHESVGRNHIYHPLVSKKEYSKFSLRQLVGGYFNNSYKQLVSFFANSDQLTVDEIEELRQVMDDQIKRKKKDK